VRRPLSVQAERLIRTPTLQVLPGESQCKISVVEELSHSFFTNNSLGHPVPVLLRVRADRATSLYRTVYDSTLSDANGPKQRMRTRDEKHGQNQGG
jgi:hypothetical protein